MGEPYSTAISLLLIGMITVFVVLFLVYLTGNLLISFVNKYLPEAKPALSREEIDPAVLAAITSAVDIFTEGSGRVTHVKKQK